MLVVLVDLLLKEYLETILFLMKQFLLEAEVVDQQEVVIVLFKQVLTEDQVVVDQDIQVLLVAEMFLLKVLLKEVLVVQDVMTMQQLVAVVALVVQELPLLHPLQDEVVLGHRMI